MTKAQIELLKKCIYALRTAEYKNEEVVEVGKINGVDPRTAQSLLDAGLLVTDWPSYANEHTNTHVRFPTAEEMEEWAKGD